MRILDEDNDRAIKNVTLYFSPVEARTLGSSLLRLAENPDNNHNHVEDEEFQHEITVSVYTGTEENLKYYDDRSKKIILEDQ